MKYHRVKDGEWVTPERNGHRMACCDCGLVHTMDFRVRKGKIQFRPRRNRRSTGQMRRWMNVSDVDYSRFLIRQIAKKYERTMRKLA